MIGWHGIELVDELELYENQKLRTKRERREREKKAKYDGCTRALYVLVREMKELSKVKVSREQMRLGPHSF